MFVNFEPLARASDACGHDSAGVPLPCPQPFIPPVDNTQLIVGAILLAAVIVAIAIRLPRQK